MNRMARFWAAYGVCLGCVIAGGLLRHFNGPGMEWPGAAIDIAASAAIAFVGGLILVGYFANRGPTPY
jgi:hypothetical protein